MNACLKSTAVYAFCTYVCIPIAFYAVKNDDDDPLKRLLISNFTGTRSIITVPSSGIIIILCTTGGALRMRTRCTNDNTYAYVQNEKER